MKKQLFPVIVVTTTLAGCAALKPYEQKGYQAIATGASTVCEGYKAGGLFVDQERVEARREIRQRGSNGPIFTEAQIQYLMEKGVDEKTARATGPIVVLGCAIDGGPGLTEEQLDLVASYLARPWAGGDGL